MQIELFMKHRKEFSHKKPHPKKRSSIKRKKRFSPPNYLPFLLVLTGIMILIYTINRIILASNQGSNSKVIASFFTPSVQYWQRDILRWSSEWNLDPNLIATVMQIESCGNPKAQSSAGAMGLFQVMPFHFEEDDLPFDPEVNASKGLAYLQSVYDEANHDIKRSFAAYNGGISIITEYETEWFDETIRYASWGSAIYLDAKRGKGTSLILNDWIEAGGNVLCEEAEKILGNFYE